MDAPKNVSGIAKATPTGSRVLVKLDDEPEPDKNDAAEGSEPGVPRAFPGSSMMAGEVIACGPQADSDQEPGDRVILKHYGEVIEDGGRRYVLVESRDIHAQIAGPGKAKRTATKLAKGGFAPKPEGQKVLKVKITAHANPAADAIDMPEMG